jgi:hypothetical protein
MTPTEVAQHRGVALNTTHGVFKLNKMRSLRYTTLPLLLHRLEYPGPLHLSEASCRLVLVVAAR